MLKRIKKRIQSWIHVENEILIPFVLISVLAIICFGVITYVNGYNMKMDREQHVAGGVIGTIYQDLQFLCNRVPKEDIRVKYSVYDSPNITILDENQKVITQSQAEESGMPENLQILASATSPVLKWQIYYIIDKQSFISEHLEEQKYVVLGAIVFLLIVIQCSIFIAHSIAQPIQNMSETCKLIDRDKGSYQQYDFAAASRGDEIGQLATTFQNLLKNMEVYTRTSYTSKMVASLAHEIKNPLTGIRSGIQVLKGRTTKAGDEMLCTSMIKEVDRVTDLINQLFNLTVTRESIQTQVNLQGIFEELQLLYSKQLESMEATITLQIPKNFQVYVNEGELKQILHNLISNSIRALKDRTEGEIGLVARREAGKNLIIVRDNGCGMPQEELHHIREPFYSKSINGIGLGLAIVDKLVEQNHGQMDIQSHLGEGTCTTLYFEEKKEDES